MTDYAYGPGEWTALAHEGRAALLDPAIAADAVTQIWESLSAGGTLESWLEVLAGNGLAALPSFGFVEPGDDGVRVVVRGEVVALVEDYDISAGGMRTWREHVASEGTGVVLKIADGEATYPLVGGVVLASTLHIGDVTAAPADAGSDDQDEETASETDAVVVAGAVESTDTDTDTDVEAVAEADVAELDAADETPSEEPTDGETDGGDAVEGDAVESETEAAAEGEPGDTTDEESPEAEQPSEESWSESAEEVQLDNLPEGEQAAGEEPLAPSEPDQDAAEGVETAEPVEESAQPEVPADPWAAPPADPWAAPPAPAAPVSQWGPPVAGAGAIAEPVAADPDAGDHDGYTIRAGDIPEHESVDHTLAPAQEEQGEEQQAAAAPSVVLSLSTGQQVELDQPVLIGRAPESSRFGFGETPRLVTVPSPQQDISRTHVEIKLEGDHVLVTDLRSTNGTVVILPGAPPRRLHPGESVPVPAGTVIDLGDGVTAVVAAPEATAPLAY